MEEVPEINRAFNIANRDNLSREELFIYDQQGAIRLARQEGSQEKAQEIAHQLLDVLDDSTIAKTIGLTIEEMRQLR